MSLPDEARNQQNEDGVDQLVREVQKLARRFWAFVRSRSPECWMFFAAGLVIGLFVG